ncbi:MAG: preprotein translocase subunit SecE [Verrucomicrobiaceae bacterium]|nr:MAG: preprotein translocase subunit SecE [Verrucomicrobiaceae bacterium]
MQFLEYIKIADNWVATGIVYAILIAAIILVVKHFAKIGTFVSEVKGELKKASWPWESDPKIKGFRKYKELVDSTVVVLIAMILLAGFVQLFDFIHVAVITFLTNLGR